ncbi:MAG: fused MFS/spermidine synthase [Chloroflexi bacterium]|nr:fused MFS/spermidine synthase [Chloroflexota bacterium]
MNIRARLWNPYAVVFLGSACTMIIELVASRLIAPQLGVSLYTWTSVIGVILAGISLGNYLGGRLADRHASTPFLGYIFAFSSLASLSILALGKLMQEAVLPTWLPLMVWVVVYIAAIFFIPSVLLGCVSPIVVKLSLTSLAHTGATVGKIYAWSTVGSIVGTFATGFFLISWFGTKTVILLVAALLMVVGLWFITDTRRRTLQTVSLLLAVVFGGAVFLLWQQEALAEECLRETNYFCIKVSDQDGSEGKVRRLVLDRLVHSYSNLEDPTDLVYGYEQTYAKVMAPMMEQRPDLSALFIGGGGYTFPRYLEAMLPDSHLEVVEIDPEVTEVAFEMLGLRRDTRMGIHDMDARLFLVQHEPEAKYDVVFGDAFNDYSVPYHLTTLEFAQMVRGVLWDDGLYLVNIVDGGPRGHFFRAYVRTLQEVFPHVAVIPNNDDWRASIRNTFVILASPAPLPLAELAAQTDLLTQEDLDAYLSLEEPLVLRDDYVPVDNLLAPVFEDSARR